MTRSMRWGSETIAYQVRFSPSRRTLSIEVHPDGQVMVRAPTACPEDLITQRVQKRAPWISRQLAEFDSYRPRTPQRQYVSGENHPYLGRRYRLKISAERLPQVRLMRGVLRVGLADPADRERVRSVLLSWYGQRAREVFEQVLAAMLPRVRCAKPPRLSVRTMESRWGSLSPAGTMTLNARLVGAPLACIEYVVAHELCHMKFRNHDAQFFGLLARVMPDWEQRKRRLETALL